MRLSDTWDREAGLVLVSLEDLDLEVWINVRTI